MQGRAAAILFRTLGTLLCVLPSAGCSVRQYTINRLGDALAGTGTTFASDEDPDLIAAAVPFSLKLMESVLEETPRHRELLLATCRGFTQYAYAFVQQEAEALEHVDYDASLVQHRRVARLYLRARDYGLRGLETRHRGFAVSLRADPRAAVASADLRDVPLLYWTAAAWGSAVSVSKDEPALIGELHIVEALIDRALQLDEAYDNGAIHAFLISYEVNRPGDPEQQQARSKRSFERALELSQGQSAAPLVAYAEAVALPQADHVEFQRLLEEALAIDPDAAPDLRLSNLVLQRRARWLLGRLDELFLLPETD